MKLMRMALTSGLLLVLAGCGNNSPVNPPITPPITPPVTGGSISGTVTAPAGGDITSTTVYACAQSDAQCASALSTTVDSAGAYSFTGLQAVPYAIAAIKDVDASNTLTNGDYLGVYSTDGTNPALVTPPAISINITLQVYGSVTTPTPPTPPTTPPITPPTTPPVTATLTGTWSGTTTTTQLSEQTTFTLTQSDTQVSGSLQLVSAEGTFEGSVTGSASSTSATVSSFFGLTNGGEVEYRYEGTFSETTYSGTVTLLVNGAAADQGQFSVTRSSTASSSLHGVDARLLNHIFEAKP